MSLRNISMIVLLVLSSGYVSATDFTIYNKSQLQDVGYILVHGGSNVMKWNDVKKGVSKWGTSKMSQLIGIWLSYRRKLGGQASYYFIDVSALNIPVVKLGVPIVIGNNGHLTINGQPLQAQQMQNPRFPG